MPWQIFIVFASMLVAACEEMPPNVSIGQEQWQTNRIEQ